jgi:DNA-binding MarR family transcriptional regulator
MDSAHLASVRKNNIGIMLLSLIEDYEVTLRQAYAGAGFGDVRRPHGYVLRYLEQRGSRITDIAQRAGITKQTTGKIVQNLVRLGYVTVRNVAGDNRVRLVQFSARGRELVNSSNTLIVQIHDSYAERVGRDTVARFETALEQFIRQLAPAIPELSGEGWSTNPFFHFGRYMVEIAADFDARLRRKLAEQGFPGVKRSYLALLFHLDIDGSRLAALAQRIAVTPQAASLTIAELVRAGFIYQALDPRDQRARLIQLSPRGRALMEAIALAAEEINTDYAELVGAEAVAQLRTSLLRILQRMRFSVFV